MSFTRTLKPHEFNPWRDKRPLLGQLDIELTERCNNACVHCLINLPEHDAKARGCEMDTAFVNDILQQAAGLGCLTVRFTGGEPLLREDFTDLYLSARRLGMQVILFTNARRMTRELAQLMARIPPGRVVEVTVYGMHSESYDTVAATHGAFNEFWQGVELLRRYDIPFIVKLPVLPSNRHEIAEFEAFAATLPWMDRRPAYLMNFDLRARRDNPAKNRLIRTLRLTSSETVEILASDPHYRTNMREFAGKFMGPPGDRLFNCGAGHSPCVDAYGNVQMCMGLRHPGMVHNLVRSTCFFLGERNGRIPSSSTMKGDSGAGLHYALTDLFPRLREIRASNSGYLKRCARCFLKGLCEQCPAKAWQEHGTLDTPVEYLCDVAHAQARYLGWLEADEQAWEIERVVWSKRIAGSVDG